MQWLVCLRTQGCYSIRERAKGAPITGRMRTGEAEREDDKHPRVNDDQRPEARGRCICIHCFPPWRLVLVLTVRWRAAMPSMHHEEHHQWKQEKQRIEEQPQNMGCMFREQKERRWQ